MNASEPTEVVPARRSWRKYLILAGLLILVPVLLGVGTGIALHIQGKSKLRQALAEADELDPGWRLDDLESRRATFPDAANSALVVRAAAKLLPKPWPDWSSVEKGMDPDRAAELRQELDNGFEGSPPPQLLDEGQLAPIRGELRRVAPAVKEALRLAEMPHGRYVVGWSPFFFASPTPHIDDIGLLRRLLGYEVMLRAKDRDFDGALNACHALLNVGRSLGDEPMLSSQLQRVACSMQAVQHLERALAQGQPSDRALAGLQQALAEEAEETLLLYGLRGERIASDTVMRMLVNGPGPSFKAMQAMLGDAARGQTAAFDDTRLVMAFGSMPQQHASILHLMNEIVEAAKLPPVQQQERLRQFDAEFKVHPPPALARLLVPSVLKIGEACGRYCAQLRCAAAALAMERYRQAQGRWPDKLDALAPKYLVEVPDDPFDGKPLRLRRFAEGIVVYSVGPDAVDDGGVIDRKGGPGTDVGVRVWDVRHRRQPGSSPTNSAQSVP
jgi:hypothetical protein